MSFDTPEANRAFRDNEDFPYPLLSDTDRTVAATYGALRAPDERYADWPKRISYLIDPDGLIAACFEVADFARHPEEVLAALRGLQTPDRRARSPETPGSGSVL